MPYMVLTGPYEVDTSGVSILEGRKLRYGNQETCPRSPS